jgi:hypothetical protein
VLDLTLLVIAKEPGSFANFSVHCGACDIRLMVNVHQDPLSLIANRELRIKPRRVFGLVHADTIFRAGALEAFVAAAERGEVCGIVGRTLDGFYRWCFKEPGFEGDRVRGPGLVSTLDGCSIFFRTDLGLAFDAQTFDSFHCHVEDLCLQASQKGIDVTVPHADATHASELPSPAWRDQHGIYRRRLAQKWRGVRFQTT